MQDYKKKFPLIKLAKKLKDAELLAEARQIVSIN